jgi:hypothetical protein
MIGRKGIQELEGCRRKRSLPILIYYPGFYLEGLRENYGQLSVRITGLLAKF